MQIDPEKYFPWYAERNRRVMQYLDAIVRIQKDMDEEMSTYRYCEAHPDRYMSYDLGDYDELAREKEHLEKLLQVALEDEAY